MMNAISRAFGSVVCAAAFLALAPAALAQPASNAPASDQAGIGAQEIVVPSERQLREAVRKFVDDIAEPTRNDPLARFDARVCPGVIGARANAAQALIDRIAVRALELDLNVGEPGCRANVLVIVTPDAERFTAPFVEQNFGLFGTWQQGQTQGASALQRFKASTAPVRWWHVIQTVTDRGEVLGANRAGAGSGLDEVPVANVNTASRVRAGVRKDVNRVIVIVDANKIARAPFSAVADYIAMVSLAQINPDAKLDNASSILTLFDDIAGGEAPQTALTAWDKAYLEGLYGARRYARSSTSQEGQITTQIVRSLTEPAPSKE